MNNYTPKWYFFAARGGIQTSGFILLKLAFLFELLAQINAPLHAQTNGFSALPSSERTIFASEGRPSQILNNETPAGIIVGLPTAEAIGNGRLSVFPNTSFISGESSLRPGFQGGTRRETIFDTQGRQPLLISPIEYSSQAEPVESQLFGASSTNQESGETSPVFEPIMNRLIQNRIRPRGRVRALFQKVFGCDCGPGGIGRERLAYALFSIDSATPGNQKSLQLQLDYGRAFLDRAELYWASIGGRGPANPEGSVKAQEARLLFETGSDKFSITTVVPFRSIDPSINPNHTGLSDISLTTKTVMLDGQKLQLTQIFRSIFNTGSSSSGMGTGHISFEPGMLARFKFRPQTEFQGSLTYLFPVGADPIASGQAIRWGLGGVHTTIDSDNYALLSTLELTGWNVLSGRETLFNVSPATTRTSDGTEIVNLTTGLRWVFDNGGDLGLFEAGFASVLPISSDRWFDHSLMFEFRWSQ